jgi:hypothetical protein
MKEPKQPTPKLPDQKVQNVQPQKPLGPSTTGKGNSQSLRGK